MATNFYSWLFVQINMKFISQFDKHCEFILVNVIKCGTIPLWKKVVGKTINSGHKTISNRLDSNNPNRFWQSICRFFFSQGFDSESRDNGVSARQLNTKHFLICMKSAESFRINIQLDSDILKIQTKVKQRPLLTVENSSWFHVVTCRRRSCAVTISVLWMLSIDPTATFILTWELF